MPREWLSQFALRLRSLFLRHRLDRDLEDELQFHLSMREQHLQSEGLPPTEARTAARRQFGNAARIKESSRDLWTFVTVETFWGDLRYGARMLAKSPGFAAVAILTLALGIGANTAMFAVTNATLLKPLPYPNPSRLVFLRERLAGAGPMSLSMPNFEDLAEQNHTFEQMAAYDSRELVLTGRGEPRLLLGVRVSATFFSLLGARIALGRLLTSADDHPGAPPAILLSYGFWQDALAGDPAILGRALVLNGKSYEVVGVMARSFHFLYRRQPEIYLPIGLLAATSAMANRGNHGSLSAIGRLRPGVSLAAARADLDSTMARLARRYPAADHGHLAFVESLSKHLHGHEAPTLWLLQAAVGLVLLMVCANLASLELTRGATRLHEFAIRTAIGAGRSRILLQLFSESLLLAMAGGVAGMVLAAISLNALVRVAPRGVPGLTVAGIGANVLLFNFLIAAVAGMVFAFAPALPLSRLGPVSALRQNQRSSTNRSGERLRRVFLVAEVALAVILATASGLMLRSLAAAQNTNPGFDPHNLLALDVQLTGSRFSSSAQSQPSVARLRFIDAALGHLRALPGVASAGAATCPPVAGECWDYFYSVPGKPAPTGMAADAEFSQVDPAYFSTVRAPLLAGRGFAESDNAASESVTIINQAMARTWWPHASPLGNRIRVGEPNKKGETFRIVGVVSNVRQDGMDVPQMPEAFFPIAQKTPSAVVFVARTRGNPEALISAATAAIHAANPDLPVRVHPMTALTAASLAERRFITLLLGLFGVLAVGLACLGVYGVISFAVAQRTQEIGVRIAVGAAPRDVLGLVLRLSARLTILGIGIGLAAAFAVTHAIRGLFYGVSAADPVTFAAVALLLILVALVACWIPARRAIKVDPNVALRCE